MQSMIALETALRRFGYPDARLSSPDTVHFESKFYEIAIHEAFTDHISRNIESQNVEAESVLAKPGAVVFKGKKADVISGLDAIQSSKTYKLFITNQKTTKCKGDVIIDSVVFLNNLVLDTDAEGCRLYVTGQ